MWPEFCVGIKCIGDGRCRRQTLKLTVSSSAHSVWLSLSLSLSLSLPCHCFPLVHSVALLLDCIRRQVAGHNCWTLWFFVWHHNSPENFPLAFYRSVLCIWLRMQTAKSICKSSDHPRSPLAHPQCTSCCRICKVCSVLSTRRLTIPDSCIICTVVYAKCPQKISPAEAGEAPHRGFYG